MAEEAHDTCVVERGGGLLARADDECVSAVGRQIFEALGLRTRRLFGASAPGSAPDLVLEVSVADAAIHGSAGLRTVALGASVTIRSSDSGELARVRVEGSSQVIGDARAAIEGGFERAAGDAADGFGHAFANSETVVRWLIDRRVAPVGSSILGPYRGDVVAFVDAGGSATQGRDGTGSGLLARVGIAGSWFVAQGVATTWSTPWGPASGISASALGLELGPVLRLSRSWEVRATAGIHLAFGSVDASASPQFATPRRRTIDFSRKLPAVAAAVQYAFWPGWSGAGRIRVGLEARKHFGGDAIFDELRDVVPTAGTSLGLFLGVELAWVRSRIPPLLLH